MTTHELIGEALDAYSLALHNFYRGVHPFMAVVEARRAVDRRISAALAVEVPA